MIIKCNCNNCSTHIEFESGNEGEVVTCPACNLETTLYAPPPPQPPPLPPKEIPKSLANPIPDPVKPGNTSSRDAISQVRGASCYRALRALVDVAQILFIIAVVIFAVKAFIAWGDRLPKEPSVTDILAFFYILLASGLGIVLIIAVKQAALLLVDIADCQIQLVKCARESRGGKQ